MEPARRSCRQHQNPLCSGTCTVVVFCGGQAAVSVLQPSRVEGPDVIDVMAFVVGWCAELLCVLCCSAWQ